MRYNMAQIGKILLSLLLLIHTNSAFPGEPPQNQTTDTTTSQNAEEELIQSETKDGQLEIIKRIKKINPDGSYTIGYEADDGSFKIESRDVLGNIKGTYGFVDEEGEIKRVSYSSSNASEVFTKHEPVAMPEFPSSVVRVQTINSKGEVTSSTKRPVTVSSTFATTTASTPTTTPLSVIQSIARRRASTTLKPIYHETSRSTTKPHSVTYSSAAPRVLLQRPSIVTSTKPPRKLELRPEGQIGRPEVLKTTEHPLFKPTEDIKPVNEEHSETRTNILRRQLPQTTTQSSFNIEEHVYGLQQSLGHNDVSDIYNNGASITSRPLFTTTRSITRIPIIPTSTTATPIIVAKPTPRYVANYQRNQLQEVESNTATYRQSPEDEVVTSTEPASTSTNIPVVQIPPNRQTSEPLVAVGHPFQQRAILVPISHLQNRIVPQDEYNQNEYNARRNFVPQQQSAVEIERVNVKRLNPVALRPLPVLVDSNGYIREMPPNVPTPYPLPVPVTPVTVSSPGRNIDEELESNEVESIHPPVSTRDFQVLLNHLIMRQKRLERINDLTNPKRHPEFYQRPVKYQRAVQATVRPIFVQRYDQPQPTGSTRQYVAVRPQEDAQRYQYYQQNEEEVTEEPKRIASNYVRQHPGYLPMRRASRLLNGGQYVHEEETPQSHRDEYLPPEVREMLLLRMLQLAMNPSLPLDEEEQESEQVATVPAPQFRRPPVRNVEILGEEEDTNDVRKRRPVSRTKRFKDEDMEYME
ncbi:uncharacterized protein [Euwallacea similis]|uniref:uncharacterized protein n=1 Tax=Euwallacea similis TaxID=1736056 RepID=UPI00344E543B